MKVSRRTFLKFMAAGGGCVAALLLSPLPWRLGGDLAGLTQPGPLPLPRGKEERKRSLYSMGQNLVPVEVRIVDGTARQTSPPAKKQLEKAGSPFPCRGITSLPASEIQNLARPSRITSPLLKKNGRLEEVSWKEALSALQAGLHMAGASVAVVSGEEFSTGAILLRRLVKGNGSDNFFRAPDQSSSQLQAAALLGITGALSFDIAESSCLLTIGADWLESWGPSYYLRNRLFANESFGESGLRLLPRHIYCGPYKNATARHADIYLPLRPGDEGALLLGLGSRILASRSSCLQKSELGKVYLEVFEKVFAAGELEQAARATGLPLNELERLTSWLLAAERPLVVLGSALGLNQSPHVQVLGICLNLMLGNYGRSGGLYALPLPENRGGDFNTWLGLLLAGKTQPPRCLLLHSCNPVYTFAGADRRQTDRLNELLADIPFKVALSVYSNESSARCDLVLPIRAGLESWEQVYCPAGEGRSGSFGVASPAAPAPANVPSVAEIIASLAEGSLKISDNALPAEKKVFADSCSRLGIARSALGSDVFSASFAAELDLPPMAGLLNMGLCDKKNILPEHFHSQNMFCGLELVVLAYQEHLNFSMGLSCYRSQSLLNKAVAEGRGKEGIAWLHPLEARQLNLESGDRAALFAGEKQFNVIIALTEGLAPGCVGMYAGFGHQGGDEFSRGYGVNVFDLFEFVFDPDLNVSCYRQPEIRIKRN
ncbi:MAG: molybdopterin-dependent oxidoreductase [Desulfovibrionaceae bacterium]|nr:molybdopterin-dependent oxidoreductase [Desulfovibrionaceae bacterium]